MAQDPYARYLQQAEELFSGGETVRAGQIWQAVLKQVPDHAAARDGLMRVKAALDAQAASEAAKAAETHRRATDSSVEIPAFPEPEPAEGHTLVVPPPPSAAPAVMNAPVVMDEDTQEKLLREGCTLFDMGQTEDALRKWDQLLAAVPDHAMALVYARDARKELGLPLDGSVSPSSPPQVHPVTQEVPIYGPEAEAADKLLREGCLLYDMGLPEEAIGKWDQAIKLAPYRSDIQSFLDNAHKDIADAKSAPQAVAPAPRALSHADEKVKQAEHLIGMQRFEEAAFTYQQALDLEPGHQAAKAGLLRCRAAQGSPARSVSSSTSGSGPIRIEMDRPDPEPEAKEEAPAPALTSGGAAQPPAALTKPAPAPRAGLQVKVPESFDVSKIPDWVKDPKLWIGLGAALAVIIGGTLWYKGYARDSQLQADVAAAHRAAVAKAAHDAEVPSLAETPSGILSEGKQALDSGDAVRAYLRAQTLLKRDPSNGAAAQLLDQAKASLPLSGLVGATAEEYQQHLHEGDLDQAGKVMDALLRANPDDPNLRTQALRLSLRLAEDHASQGRWGDAQANLELGR
ncbi:MAG TPA: tetratricopeptide repeat protein, partial [Holophagaceae bacterium]|nr:tetratricopeptide repeat protein [Holophagaceae bacterium]